MGKGGEGSTIPACEHDATAYVHVPTAAHFLHKLEILNSPYTARH